MRKLGLLLTLVIVLLTAMATPAVAARGGASGDRPGADHRPGNDHPPGDDRISEAPEHGGAAQQQSGSGMNRQGGPSSHPGNGWKDPGQDQGSPANTADPDCTGNRSDGPQATNIGACDDPGGAADKPGGSGGFDADKDWNNGCGNDTDFEDDNNGRCLGPPTTRDNQPGGSTTPPKHPPTHPPTPPTTNRPSNPPSNPPTTNPPTTNPPTTNPPSTNPPSTNPPPTNPPPTNPPSTNPPGGTNSESPETPPVVVGGPVTGPSSPPPAAPPAAPPDVPVVVTVGRPATPPPNTELFSGPLPFTGPSHTLDLTALALALIAVGAHLVSYERRRG